MDNLEREARERKKKVVALASLPLSVGFFVWRLQDNTSAAPPPPPPKPIVQKAAPEVQKAVGAVLALEKEKVIVVAAVGKDPFRPTFSIVPPAEQPATPSAPSEPAKASITELIPGPVAMPLPPLRPFEPPADRPVMGVPAIRPATETTRPALPVEPARPAMPYFLTGIVKGNPDIAILRHSDGSRRIARVGDALDKTYRLTMIEESFVMVSGDGDAISLRLGSDVRPMVAPEDKK